METAGDFNVGGEEFQMLLFADDVVVVAGDPEKLQKFLNELNNKAKKVGLSIHDGKTKWMKNAFCPQFTMKLGSENIELVEQYSYLWRIVQMNDDLGVEQSRRGRAACIAFTKLKDIFCDTKTTPSVKAELFNSTVLPALLYECETWNTTLDEENIVETTQRIMERRMVGVSRLQHIANEDAF
ncbi:unnamed protein product [Toxocara canis]|uniref:Reverse transcriptase domain-containing protein n=1 Tax=Toxocara canis TaxID=6265 RepID=A0A183UHB1_TOXCA|nr:unnamed protein product [Toxocara canis]